MSEGALVLCLAAAVYVLRLSGFLPVWRERLAGWAGALGYVPVAALAALVAGSIAAAQTGGLERPAALAVGGLLAWRLRRPWVCILGGIATFLALAHL
jgi:branched-subunit amino acid transport protein